MGSLVGFPWPFRKHYEPVWLVRIQDMGPPSPCWLPSRPAFRRRPDFSPHEERHGRADFGKPPMRRPTPRSRLPIKRSRPYPQSLHPPNGGATGRGYSKACHPRIPEHAWHGAPYGLGTTRPARHCCHVDPGITHDGPPAWPTDGGPPLTRETPEGGHASSQSAQDRAGSPQPACRLPRRRRPIKETRRGGATVIAHRAAAL